MGVNSAVLSFNEGSSGIYCVFKHLNLDFGKNTITSPVKKDQKRLQNMVKKGQPKKKKKKKKRVERKLGKVGLIKIKKNYQKIATKRDAFKTFFTYLPYI